MLCYQRTVNPYLGVVINCSEVYVHSFSIKGIRKLKAATVPDHVMRCGIPDSAKLAFKAEWNLNSFRECSPELPVVAQALPCIIKFKFPFSIQIDPILAYILRSWIFRS
ncbi:hypothetical protein D3C74_258160 [compost metagenome]